MTAYEVVVSDRAEQQQEQAFLRILRLLGLEFANLWLESLGLALTGLADFPGPRAHAIDPEATTFFGVETRRFLFYGTRKRRMATPYRVLYTIFDAENDSVPGTIRILAFVHGAALLTPETD